MLTVKHITPNYEQSIRLAYEVRFASEPKPEEDRKTNEDTHRHLVYADLVGVGTHRYEDGTVYVMNDNGATVAKYDLGGWHGPSEAKPAIQYPGKAA